VNLEQLNINPDDYMKGLPRLQTEAPLQGEGSSRLNLSFSGLSTLGCILLIIGLITVAYFWLVFDVGVKVEIPEVTILGETFGGETYRVANLDKMNQRQNGVVAGVGLSILGALLLGFGEVSRRKS